jgi:hypothetical protein
MPAFLFSTLRWDALDISNKIKAGEEIAAGKQTKPFLTFCR